MTLKVYMVFAGLHIACGLAELWAQSAMGVEGVGWDGVGPITHFSEAMASLQTILQNPFGVLGALGKIAFGLFAIFAFSGYENVFSDGWGFFRTLLASVGFAVMFLTIWRVMGGVIASVIGNIAGGLGKIFGGPIN